MRLDIPDGSPRTIALTLDACGGGTDLRILQTLVDREIPATIFVTALWLHRNETAAGILRSQPGLFNVQNHGERHLPAIIGSASVFGLTPAGTPGAIRQEVERGADAIIAAGFPRPVWYRGATALYSPSAIDMIEASGFKIAGFSVSGDDGASLPASRVVARLSRCTSGDIVIAHLNRPGRPSGGGVAAGIKALQSNGVRFVRLDAAGIIALPCRSRRLHPDSAA